MAKAYRQSTAQINALSQKQQAVSAQAGAEIQKNDMQAGFERMDIQDDYYSIQSKAIEAQKKDNVFNFVLNMTELAVDTSGKLYNIIQQDQSSKADKENQSALEEGKRLLTASLYDGSSYWATGEDGKAQFVVSQDVKDWAEGYREKIRSSNGLKSVKENQLMAFDAGYESLMTGGMESSIKYAYESLNENFAQTQSNNFRDDVASYVRYGGDLDQWNASTPIKGVAAIATRTDWNSDQQQAETNAYLQKVMAQGNIEIASQIALEKGNKAAWEWINAPERGYMTVQEKQDAYSIASKGLAQRVGSVSQEASDYMEDALVSPDSTMSARQVYDEIKYAYSNEAPEVVDAAISAAKAKHKEIMNAAGSNQLNADKESGIDALYSTYNGLIGGEFDGNYINIEDTKATLVRNYKDEIERQEKAIASATATAEKDVAATKKQVLTDYQTAQKATMQKFDDGLITGEQAVSEFNANAADAREAISGIESNDTEDVWDEEVQASADAFLDEITDSYIPSKYKTQMTSSFNLLKASAKLNKTEANMTLEQRQTVRDANNHFYGMIADYIYENGAEMDPEQFAAFSDSVASELAFVYEENSPWKSFLDGTKIDGSTQNKLTMQFESANKMAWDKNGNGMLVYMDDALGLSNGGHPAAQFATEGVAMTYKNMVAEMAKQVSWITGDDVGMLQTTQHITNDDGRIVLSPEITASDGTKYRLGRKSTIEVYVPATLPSGAKDFNRGTWEDTGITPANTKEQMDYKLHLSDRYEDAKATWKFIKESISEGKLLANTVEAVVTSAVNVVRDIFSDKDDAKEPERATWVQQPLRGGKLNPDTMVTK